MADETLEDMVKSRLKDALQNQDKYEVKLQDTIDEVKELKIQLKCKHTNITSKGGFMYDNLECDDCGLKWMGD